MRQFTPIQIVQNDASHVSGETTPSSLYSTFRKQNADVLRLDFRGNKFDILLQIPGSAFLPPQDSYISKLVKFHFPGL